jgi:multidrug resistance protein
VAARRRSKRERRPLPAGFGAIWVTVAVDLIGFGIVLPILPRYAEDLAISPTVIGLVVGSFSLAQLVFSPLLGRLSDRVGRKPVIILSLCGTAVGSVITGLSGNVWFLLLGRLVDGASGASVSVAQAAAADLAEPDERPRLFGLLGAAFGVGFVLGPAIGALAALRGPHVPFFVAAAIAGVNAILAVRRLPETHPDKVAGAEPATAEPAPSVSLRKLPGAAGVLILVAFTSLVAFSGFEGTFALLVNDRFGLTISSTGAVFAAIGLALVVVQGGLVHPLSLKVGPKALLRCGLVANAIGLGLLAVAGSWWGLVPALGLLVVGQGLVSPTVASAVAGEVPPRQRGQVLGYQQAAGSLARFVGPVAAGALYQHVGPGSPYAAGSAVVVLALLLVPHRRDRGGGDARSRAFARASGPS